MAENSVSSENNQSKASGCSTLIKAGIVIFIFIMVLQVLNELSYYFGDSTILCCISLIVIVIIVFVARGRRKDKVLESEGLQVAQDFRVGLEEGKRLLSQGKREEAIEFYLQAYREGSPSVQKLAITALEEMGEVDNF